jgi:hypothetical protein
MTTLSKVTNLYADIDLFGKELKPGVALEYYDIYAISNALNLWLTSEKGDFIRNPSAGGILKKYLFKNMDTTALYKIQLELLSSFSDYFGNILAVDSIQFNPDYQNRILEIHVTYHDIRSGASDNLIVYVNSNYAHKRFEYQHVTYTGENLYRFVQITVPSNSKERLVYDTNLLKWKWNPYIMDNLEFSDPYFESILALINGQ